MTSTAKARKKKEELAITELLAAREGADEGQSRAGQGMVGAKKQSRNTNLINIADNMDD